jgi:hypothetical protein
MAVTLNFGTTPPCTHNNSAVETASASAVRHDGRGACVSMGTETGLWARTSSSSRRGDTTRRAPHDTDTTTTHRRTARAQEAHGGHHVPTAPYRRPTSHASLYEVSMMRRVAVVAAGVAAAVVIAVIIRRRSDRTSRKPAKARRRARLVVGSAFALADRGCAREGA